MSDKFDCLDCNKYLTCKDPKKARSYKCVKFVKKSLKDISEILTINSVFNSKRDDNIDLSDVEGEEKKTSDIIIANEKTNVAELIESVINSDLLTPVDTKLDDSSLPAAKNFYEFATGQHFLNVKPYVFQMLYITQFLAEFCPRCSDTKWMREEVKVTDSLALFYSKVTLLEFGVCPKCGARKSELIKEGELNYYQELCVHGDTSVFTDKGIFPIKELYLNTNAHTGEKFRKITAKYKKGKKETVTITTNKGYTLRCTPDHKVQVLDKNFDLIWVDAKDTKEYYIPIALTDCSHTNPLTLNLPKSNLKFNSRVSPAKKPKKMTPSLAIILGLLASEGSVSESCADFYNQDKRLHDLFNTCVYDVFGYKVTTRLKTLKGSSYNIKSNSKFISGVSSNNYYCSPIYNKRIYTWINYLGLTRKAKEKRVPWSIMQADSESQMAYLAAYIEGDGSVSSNKIEIWSASKKNLLDLQNLLAYHGILSSINHSNINLCVSGIQSDLLYEKIKKFLVNKLRTNQHVRNNSDLGIPITKYIVEFINSRKTENWSKRNPEFYNDSGDKIVVYFKDSKIDFSYLQSEYLYYKNFKSGKYDNLLFYISKISKNLFTKVVGLLDKSYYYDKVSDIRDSKSSIVYDITVEKDHKFVGNSFIVHNCGMAGQRCIAGDSLIYTEKGLVHIDELDTELDLEFEYNEHTGFILNGDYELAPNHAIYKCYPEETYRLELENGFFIEGTKEHPVYTANGYIPIIMAEDELVPVRFGFSAFGNQPVNTEVAKFLGYWLACGETCSLQTSNNEAFAVTKAIFNQAFKLDTQVIFDYNFSYQKISELLGFSPNASRESRFIPSLIRNADRYSVLVFLQAFFSESVSYVSLGLDSSSYSSNIVVNCDSQKILLTVSSYLLMFGILHTVDSRSLTIEIDGLHNLKFTKTFNLPSIPNNYEYKSVYTNPTINSTNSPLIYWLKVKRVQRSFVQVTYDFVVPGTHDFVANGLINHNSGKSAITAMCSAYILHKQLKLQKPNEVYGLLPSNVLHGTFVALTYKQAAETLWEPFLAYINDAPWFKEYHALMDHYGRKYNDEFYKVKDTFIAYKSKRILCLTGDSLVSTDRGLVPISNIKVGDKVKALSGKYENVSNIIRSGNKKVYELTTKDGYFLSGTLDHPILTLNSSLELEWKKIEDLTVKDYVCINNNKSKYKDFNVKFSYHEDIKPVYGRLWDYIKNLSEFTTNELKTSIFSSYTTLDSVISNLYKNKLIERKRNKKRNSDFGKDWKKMPRYSYRVRKEYRHLDHTLIRDKTGLSTNSHSGYLHTFPTEMTEDLALLLGYMVSDGWFNRTYGFGNTDKRVISEFSNAFEITFNRKANFYLAQRSGEVINSFESASISNYDYYEMHFNDADKIAGFFEYVGLIKGNAYTKEIPWSILQAPKKYKKIFLQALFEGDRSTGSYITYTSKSDKLLRQLQIILLEFGIVSNRKDDRLLILKRPAKIFHKNIGFRFKTFEDNSNTFVSSVYAIPFTRSKTRDFVNSPSFTKGCSLHVKNNNKISMQVTKNNDYNLYNKVKFLSSLGIVFQQIDSVSYKGLDTVFDITVDSKEHLFTANGIVVHNCYPAGPNKKTLRGRCLVGSTLINTNKGFIQLNELIKNKGQLPVSDLLVDTHTGVAEVSHTYKDISKTIKIKTRNGFSLEGTPEHPMLVIDSDLAFVWKRLDELSIGDFIVSKTASNSPMYGDYKVSLDMATLLGYYVANGYRNEISSDDPKVIDRLYSTFHRVTGFSPTSYGSSKSRAATHYLTTGKKGEDKLFIRDYFEPLGYKVKNSKDKYIPLSIRSASKEVLHEFLEAYFECDCGVNGGGGSRNTAPSEIEIGSSSKKLASQLHTILFHNYNILGRLEKKVQYDKLNKNTGNYDAKRVHWLVTITGNDAYRFLQCFKRAKVQKYSHRFHKVPDGFASNRRNIPFIRKYLWDIFEDARMTDTSGKRLRRLILEDGSKILNKIKPKCFAKLKGNTVVFPNTPEFLIYEEDWSNLLPIIEKINSNKAKVLSDFLKLQAHYEEVVEVKIKERETVVYDITVPEGHAFTANCLVSHNTRFLCLDGDSLVSTSKGLLPIKENLNGLGTNVGNEYRKIIGHCYSGTKKCYEVSLKNGLKVIATANHKFKVINKHHELVWKRVKDLTVNDFVVCSLGGNFPSTLPLSFNHDRDNLTFPSEMTEDLSKLIGYLIADGNYIQTHSEISFTTTSKKKLSDFLNAFKNSFGYSCRVSSWLTTNGKKAFSAVFSFTAIIEFFKYLGLTPATSEFKEVPWSILQAPRSCVVAFINAALSCDGGVSATGIYYASTSQKLLQQMQLLFMRLGYPAYINDNNVRLKPYTANEFIKKDYNGWAKRDKKLKIKNIGKSTAYSEYRIPYISLNTGSNILYAHTKSNLTCESLRTHGEISHLEDKSFIFSKVSSIEFVGKREVYDIQVDDLDCSFTVNGIVSHNSAIDEIGWFDNNRDEGKVKMDANEVYVALDRSLLTVRSAANRLIRQGFDDIPNGYAFNVSSPSSARDKITELVNQSKTSRKIFGFKRATWEMNPNITREDLSEEFFKDPQAAERDYGCNPPLSDNAFFSSFAAIEGCFIGKPNKMTYSYAQRKAKDGSITRYAKIVEVAKSTKPNVLALDAGFSGNSFSLVCGHLHEGIPILTCFCEVMPNPGMPLNHSLIFRELVLPLIKERNVKVLISDRWQNIKLLQDAEMEYEDLITMSYSLKYDNFWVIKQSMFDSEVVFPKLKRDIEDILKYDQSKYPFCFTDPVEHLALQIMTVRDMGNTVDKGDNLTDDTFRAACLAIYALTNDELYDIFSVDGLEEIKNSTALGHVRSKSGGSSGKSGEVMVSSSGKAIGVTSSRRS